MNDLNVPLALNSTPTDFGRNRTLDQPGHSRGFLLEFGQRQHGQRLCLRRCRRTLPALRTSLLAAQATRLPIIKGKPRSARRLQRSSCALDPIPVDAQTLTARCTSCRRAAATMEARQVRVGTSRPAARSSPDRHHHHGTQSGQAQHVARHPGPTHGRALRRPFAASGEQRGHLQAQRAEHAVDRAAAEAVHQYAAIVGFLDRKRWTAVLVRRAAGRPRPRPLTCEPLLRPDNTASVVTARTPCTRRSGARKTCCSFRPAISLGL